MEKIKKLFSSVSSNVEQDFNFYEITTKAETLGRVLFIAMRNSLPVLSVVGTDSVVVRIHDKIA